MSSALHDTSSLDGAHAYRIHRASRLLRRHLVGLLAELGADITPEQYFILFRLHERDGRVQGDFVDPDLDDRPNVARMVDKLERAGLIRRERDTADRRRVLVYFTADGRALMDRLLERVPDVRGQLLGDLDPGDLAALERVLSHLEHVLTT